MFMTTLKSPYAIKETATTHKRFITFVSSVPNAVSGIPRGFNICLINLTQDLHCEKILRHLNIQH